MHEACTVARAAVAGGCAETELLRMSRHGASGKHPQNELRDYRREHARRFGQGLEPQTIRLTLLDEDDVEVISEVPVVCPYEALHFLYERGDLQKSCLSESLALKSYWEHVLAQDWAANHPLKNNESLWEWTIPLVFFTDGAEFSKSSAAEGVFVGTTV